MIPLALGLAGLALLLWAAGAFARADVRQVKALLAWIAALAGLALGALLLLSGRGAAALSGLVLIGPAAWGWWQRARPHPPPREAGPRMGRREALAILGLPDGASEAEVREAWVRLMRQVHPDGGGTDWLAARVNQARDVLLGR